MKIKIEVPDGLLKYCERNGIKVENLIKIAITKYMFQKIYEEITA